MGSRSQQTADAFAAAHGVERAHSTYEGLLTDGEVDVSVIARAGGGGGHRRAAGFTTDLSQTDLVAFLREQVAAQL